MDSKHYHVVWWETAVIRLGKEKIAAALQDKFEALFVFHVSFSNGGYSLSCFSRELLGFTPSSQLTEFLTDLRGNCSRSCKALRLRFPSRGAVATTADDMPARAAIVAMTGRVVGDSGIDANEVIRYCTFHQGESNYALPGGETGLGQSGSFLYAEHHMG